MDCHSVYLKSISKLCDPPCFTQKDPLNFPLLSTHPFFPPHPSRARVCGALPFYEWKRKKKQWHLELITEKRNERKTFKMKLKIITEQHSNESETHTAVLSRTKNKTKKKIQMTHLRGDCKKKKQTKNQHIKIYFLIFIIYIHIRSTL